MLPFTCLILSAHLLMNDANGDQVVSIAGSNSNYCIEEHNDWGGTFWASPCDDSLETQQFEYDGKSFKVKSSGKCIDVDAANYNGVSYDGWVLEGNRDEIGQRMVPKDCDGNPYQQWTLDESGRLVNDETQWCIDIHDYHYDRSYAKARVDGAACASGGNQKFALDVQLICIPNVIEWIPVLTLGAPDNSYNTLNINVGQTAFNELFHSSTYYIIKRECASCLDDYKEVYYKRLTEPEAFDVYEYMNRWKKENNIINTDFALYSTLEDAIDNKNPWLYCNYDDVPGVGAFRDCGKTAGVGCQWTSDVYNGGYGGCSKPALFSVYVATQYISGSPAKTVPVHFDFINQITDDSISSQYAMYLIYLVIVLLIVNIICFGVYYSKTKKYSNKY